MIDVHCHLGDNKFKEDIEVVVERAKLCGVKKVVVVPEFLSQFGRVCDLQSQFPDFVFSGVGVHPIQKRNKAVKLETLDEVERWLAKKPTEFVCVGEIGLDRTDRFRLDSDDLVIQEEVFRRQIRLAQQYKLPINVHSRSASGRTLEVLKDEGCQPNSVVLHAFDGTVEEALGAALSGFLLSIPPCFASSSRAEKVVESVPLDHLLLETDSPALGPTRGERNEPSNLHFSAKFLSQVKGLSVEEVIQATNNNANRVFDFRKLN